MGGTSPADGGSVRKNVRGDVRTSFVVSTKALSTPTWSRCSHAGPASGTGVSRPGVSCPHWGQNRGGGSGSTCWQRGQSSIEWNVIVRAYGPRDGRDGGSRREAGAALAHRRGAAHLRAPARR